MNNEEKSMYIKFSQIDSYYKFHNAASKIDKDVCVKRGRWSVDGKSLMGLFSIDFSNGATVYYPEDATDFEEILKEINKN